MTVQELVRGSNVGIRWVPGHEGIKGNERADELARRGASLTTPPNNPPSAAWVKRQARETTKMKYFLWWADNSPSLYQMAGLNVTLGQPSELLIPRYHLRYLLAARTGHGDFAEYHERFDHEDASLYCTCGRRKSQFHVFYCRKISPDLRIRLGPKARETIERIIGPKHFGEFVELIKDSDFFTRICPRYGEALSESSLSRYN